MNLNQDSSTQSVESIDELKYVRQTFNFNKEKIEVDSLKLEQISPTATAQAKKPPRPCQITDPNPNPHLNRYDQRKLRRDQWKDVTDNDKLAHDV
jgi:hypothetical protein